MLGSRETLSQRAKRLSSHEYTHLDDAKSSIKQGILFEAKFSRHTYVFGHLCIYTDKLIGMDTPVLLSNEELQSIILWLKEEGFDVSGPFEGKSDPYWLAEW